jgi:hypothetical protein
MAPIAAALIIVLAVVGRFGGNRNRTVDKPTTQPQSTTAASAAQSQTRQTPTSVRLKPDTTYARDGSRRRPGGSRAPRVAPSEIDARAPAALDVESIRLAALPPVASIRVAPLETIEPIDVAPLAASEIDESQRRQP